MYDTTTNLYADPSVYQSTDMTAFWATYMATMWIWLAVAVVIIIAQWRMFTKAGQPGWAAIVPIYNVYVLLQVAGRPGWWILLYLIPVVNIVVSAIVSIDVAKKFGKSGAFGFFGLFLFGFIGYPILGFGKATYNKAA